MAKKSSIGISSRALQETIRKFFRVVSFFCLESCANIGFANYGHLQAA